MLSAKARGHDAPSAAGAPKEATARPSQATAPLAAVPEALRGASAAPGVPVAGLLASLEVAGAVLASCDAGAQRAGHHRRPDADFLSEPS